MIEMITFGQRDAEADYIDELGAALLRHATTTPPPRGGARRMIRAFGAIHAR